MTTKNLRKDLTKKIEKKLGKRESREIRGDDYAAANSWRVEEEKKNAHSQRAGKSPKGKESSPPCVVVVLAKANKKKRF